MRAEMSTEEFGYLQVEDAQHNKVVYVMGRVDMKSSSNLNLFQKFLLEYLYVPLERNCRLLTDSWSIPRSRLIEVGMTHEVGGEDGLPDPAWEVITHSFARLSRPPEVER